jgi:hypothetical protein
MKRIIFISILVIVALVFNSCKKSLDSVLFGTWTVTKVEGTRNLNGVSIFSAEDNNPIGIVRFDSDGTGEQNYSFTFANINYSQNEEFSWEANEDEIIINRVSEADIIWNRTVDSENKQVASYTVVIDATQDWDYTLTMEK